MAQKIFSNRMQGFLSINYKRVISLIMIVLIMTNRSKAQSTNVFEAGDFGVLTSGTAEAKIIWGDAGTTISEVAFVGYSLSSTTYITSLDTADSPPSSDEFSFAGNIKSLSANIQTGKGHVLVAYSTSTGNYLKNIQFKQPHGTLQLGSDTTESHLNHEIEGAVFFDINNLIAFSKLTPTVVVYSSSQHRMTYESTFTITFPAAFNLGFTNPVGVAKVRSRKDGFVFMSIENAGKFYLCYFQISVTTLNPKFCKEIADVGFNFRITDGSYLAIQISGEINLYYYSLTGMDLFLNKQLEHPTPPSPLTSPYTYNDVASFVEDADFAIVAVNNVFGFARFTTGIVEYVYPNTVDTLVKAKSLSTKHDGNMVMAVMEVEVSSQSQLWYFLIKKSLPSTCHGSCGDSCIGPGITECFNCGLGLRLFLNDAGDGAGECKSTFCPQTTIQSDLCIDCSGNCASCSSTPLTCTSCLNNLFLSGNECVAECPSNQVVHNQECVANCPQNYYVGQNQICTSCGHSDCASCDPNQPSNCLSCLNGLFLDGGNCLAQCPAGKVQSPVNQICETCQTGCNSCSASQTNCNDCESGYFFDSNSCPICDSKCLECSASSTSCDSCKGEDEGSFNFYVEEAKECLEECPAEGFYTSGFNCLKCDTSCLTCSGPSQNECLSCKDQNAGPLNYFLEAESKCLAECPSENYYVENFNCLPCDGSCLTCSGPLVNECLTCKSQNQGALNFYLPQNKECLAECPTENYYAQNFECLPCDSSCLTCSGSSTNDCLSCKSESEGSLNFYLADSKECLAECPSQNFFTSGFNCLPCDGSCPTCSGPASNQCLSCPAGKGLIGGSCLDCSSPCSTCSGSVDHCLSCEGTLKLFEGNCSVDCPPQTTLLNPSDSSCVSCHESCLSCEASQTTCSECHSGYEINPEGICQEITCQPTHYLAPGSTCLPCSIGCKECSDSAENCQSCVEGYELDLTNKCQIQCKQHEVRVFSGQCLTCGNDCDQCYAEEDIESLKLICEIKLAFRIAQNHYQETESNFDILLDLIFFRSSGKNINEELIEKKINENSFEFSLKEKPEIEIEKSIFWSKSNTLQAGIILPEEVTRNRDYRLDMSITSSIFEENDTGTNRLIQQQVSMQTRYTVDIRTETVELPFTAPETVSEEELETSKKMASAAGNTLKYTSIPSEYMSIGGFVFSADQTGTTIKFSQISKLISRLRLVGIKFGKLLTSFLDTISIAFDKEGEGVNDIVVNQNGSKGKLSLYNIRLFFVKFEWDSFMDILNTSIYFLSWILKIFRWNIYWNFKKKRVVSKKEAWFVITHKKIHFALYNMNSIPIFFYGTRTLLHLKLTKDNSHIFFFTGLALTLEIYDSCELARACFSIKKVEMKEEDNDPERSNSDSTFQFMPHEITKSSFNEYRGNGFGMRNYFEEEEMIKHVMSKEKAKRIGYVRTLDYNKTHKSIFEDKVIYEYATGNLRKANLVFSSSFVFLANYFFQLRMIIYHILLVSVPLVPCIQIFLLMITELAYFCYTIKNYVKLKHLKSAHNFTAKIIQSVFFILFFSICFIILFSYKEKPVPLILQRTGVYSIIVSVFFEYFFLIWNLVLIIGTIWKSCRTKKSKEKKKSSLIKYFWVLGKLVNHKTSICKKENQKDKVRDIAALPNFSPSFPLFNESFLRENEEQESNFDVFRNKVSSKLAKDEKKLKSKSSKNKVKKNKIQPFEDFPVESRAGRAQIFMGTPKNIFIKRKNRNGLGDFSISPKSFTEK